MPAVENSSHHREHLPKLWEEAHSRLALKNLLSAALAEFFCTASFVFVATAAVTSGCHTGDTAAQSGSTEGLERGPSCVTKC
jgi:glycerol uptake facilitator-like aquaporin